MVKRRLKKVCLIVGALSMLMVAGCGVGVTEEQERERTVEIARSMVNDIIGARMDNRSIDDIRGVFDKYRDTMRFEVWDEWFDIDNQLVEFQLLIAENEGFYPVENNVNIVQYGEGVEEQGFHYTAVSTMLADGEYSEGSRYYRVYFHFQFDELGNLIKYNQSTRIMEAGL